MQNIPQQDSQMLFNIHTSMIRLEENVRHLVETTSETKDDIKEIKREYKLKGEADLEYKNMDQRVVKLEGQMAGFLERDRVEAIQTNDKIAATGTAISAHRIELNGKTIAGLLVALMTIIGFLTWLLEQYLIHTH